MPLVRQRPATTVAVRPDSDVGSSAVRRLNAPHNRLAMERSGIDSPSSCGCWAIMKWSHSFHRYRSPRIHSKCATSRRTPPIVWQRQLHLLSQQRGGLRHAPRAARRAPRRAHAQRLSQAMRTPSCSSSQPGLRPLVETAMSPPRLPPLPATHGRKLHLRVAASQAGATASPADASAAPLSWHSAWFHSTSCTTSGKSRRNRRQNIRETNERPRA